METDAKFWPPIVAAVIAAVVAFITARWQVSSKVDELTQTQFKDVIAKRIAVYPLLWEIAQTMLSDWGLAGKPVTDAWIRAFLTALTKWHAENGVFLSQNSYSKFGALREAAIKIVEKCDRGGVPTTADLTALDMIYSGDSSKRRRDPRRYGLATWLKNDLGSYKTPFLAVRPR
jgi:hypothetical protein